MTKIPVETMSPHEYLEHLQQEQYGAQLPDFAADIGDVLSANLLAALPDEHRRLLDQIAIGVLQTNDINAWVMDVPAGGKIIGFGFGLMSFMLALNKVLLTRANVLGFEPSLELTVAAEKAKSILNAFYGDKLDRNQYAGLVGVPIGPISITKFSITNSMPRFPVSPRRMILAAALSNAQTAFVVGHELGHALAGHVEERRYAWDDEKRNHAMEFEADMRGAELVFGGFKRSYDPVFGNEGAAVVQAGPDIFFTYLIFMARFLGLSPDQHSTSHPSYVERRVQLRKRFWKMLPESAQKLATSAEQLFDWFGSVVNPKPSSGSSSLPPSVLPSTPTQLVREPNKPKAIKRTDTPTKKGKKPNTTKHRTK
jgi:hypothetical protein